jgi:hypothetical protein
LDNIVGGDVNDGRKFKKMEIFVEKSKNRKAIWQGIALIFGAPAALWGINFLLIKYFNYVVVPYFLIIIPIYGICTTWRQAFLTFKPELILEENSIQYFNAIGYKKIDLSSIKLVGHDLTKQQIQLLSAPKTIIETIDLKDKDVFDVQEIFNYFRKKGIAIHEF